MILHPTPAQTPQLFEIWRICFGDPDAYITHFFEARYDPSRCLIWAEDKRAIAMLHILPCRVLLAGGGTAPAGYIYAAATLPAFRRRGIMAELLRAAFREAERDRMASLLLRPANDGLWDYYRRYGYRPAFWADRVTLAADTLQGTEDVVVWPPGAEEVLAIRDACLAHCPSSILWDQDAISYAIAENRLTGGGILALRRGNDVGYALYRVDGDEALIRELMASASLAAPLARAVARRTSAARIHIVAPVGRWSEGPPAAQIPVGMARPVHRPLTSAAGNAHPYLGLALD